MINLTLSSLLKTKRIELNLTQTQAAKASNLSLRQYQRLESSNNLDAYQQVFKALKVQLIAIPEHYTLL